MFPRMLLGYYCKRVSPLLGIRLNPKGNHPHSPLLLSRRPLTTTKNIFVNQGADSNRNMTDCGYLFEDEIPISGSSFGSGVHMSMVRPWTSTGAEPTCRLNDGCSTSSYYEKHSNDNEPSTRFPHLLEWNSLSGISNLNFASNDGCIHHPSVAIDAETSPFIPEPLIGTSYRTKAYQTQNDFPPKCIDPKLLSLAHPADDTPTEARHPFTVDTDLHPSVFSPPATSPAAYLGVDHTVDAPVGNRAAPTPGAPAQSARHSALSREANKRAHPQDSLPRYKKRRVKALRTLVEKPLYHSLPTTDRDYLDQVVANLRGASYLVSPQKLEPTVGSPTGLQLVGTRRFTGPGTAAERESVYAALIDRPVEGAYVCWICGERRRDRRLPRALDHVRGHFEHRPYHCSETHFDRSGSLDPLVSSCDQSFTCAESLKDHQAKMKDKSHTCITCGKGYTNAANVKRHVRRDHPN